MIKPTRASKAGIGYVAANGTKIKNYGEKKITGMLDDGFGVSVTLQCADVKKTLASVRRTNQNGNAVILDGKKSVMIHKFTGKATPMIVE